MNPSVTPCANVASADHDLIGPEDLIVVAVLEDSEILRQEIKTALEVCGFLVLTAESKGECLTFLQAGCRTFVLDIGLDEAQRKVEGMDTLEEIKLACESAFCAIITHQDQIRYRPIAANLHADWFSGKSRDDIAGLIERIEQAYLERLYRSSTSPSALARRGALELGRLLRKGRNDVASLAAAEARLRAGASLVLDSLSHGDEALAEDQLVLLEPEVHSLITLGAARGDGYRIVVSALWNALINQPGSGIAEEQITCWFDVLEEVIRLSPGIDQAIIMTERLETVGFNPDAPGIDGLLNVLCTQASAQDIAETGSRSSQ